MCLATAEYDILKSKSDDGFSFDQHCVSQNTSSHKIEKTYYSHQEAIEQALLVDKVLERTRKMAQMVADLTATVFVSQGREGENKLTLSWSATGGIEMMELVTSFPNLPNPNPPRSLFSIITTFIKIVLYPLFNLIISRSYLKFCHKERHGGYFKHTKMNENKAKLLLISVIKMGKMLVRIVLSISSDYLFIIFRHDPPKTIREKNKSLFLRCPCPILRYSRIFMYSLSDLTFSLVCSNFWEIEGSSSEILVETNGRENITLQWSSVISIGKIYIRMVFSNTSNPAYSLVCPNLSKLLQKDLQTLLSLAFSLTLKYIRIVFYRYNYYDDPVLSLTCTKHSQQETFLVVFKLGANHKIRHTHPSSHLERKCICSFEPGACNLHGSKENSKLEMNTGFETDEFFFSRESFPCAQSNIVQNPHEAALHQALQVDFIIQRTQRMIQIVSKLPILEENPIVSATPCETALEQAIEVDSLIQKTQQMLEMVENLPVVKKPTTKTKAVKSKDIYHLRLPWSSVIRMARICIWVSASFILLGSLAFLDTSETSQKEFQSTLLPLSFVIIWYINVAIFSPGNLPFSPTFSNNGKSVYDSLNARRESELKGFDFVSRNIAFQIKSS